MSQPALLVLEDGRSLDTGFRPRRKTDTAALTESISTLIGAEQK